MSAGAFPAAVGARAVGTRVARVEDARLLTGRGRYVDDVVEEGMLHAAFLRSPEPHARIASIDADGARRFPGVVAVYTGDDIARITEPAQAGAVIGINLMPGMKSPTFHSLATDKVRYVGDPLVLVVAEDRYTAEDALEQVLVEYEPLAAVVSYDDALDPSSPPLFEEFDDNVAMVTENRMGDVDGAFERADRVIRATISVHRHQPVPMEGRGLVAVWDRAREHLTLHSSTQSPHMLRMLLPPQIGVPMEQIRVLAADVGGGFGLKNGVSREEVAVCAAAKDLARPVKWVEDRFEHLVAAGQAREEMAEVEAAVTAEGVMLGVRMEVLLNSGAYPCDPFPGAMFANSVSGSFQGPTRIEGLAARNRAVFSNKATYVSYRGPWATADFVRERVLDVIAAELGIDPIEVRRRNYVVRDEPPLAMLNGQPFVGVTTAECLEQAAELIDWTGFRVEQEAARAEGRYLGIGMAAYLEAAPGPKVEGQQRGGGILADEITHLSVDADGTVVVVTRQQPHGQGHETTLSQVAADEVGVPIEAVRVVWGDTDVTPVALVGTGGSRAATLANGAVLHGSRQLRERVLHAAADLLEADPADLELAGGVVAVRGTPSVSLTLAELADRVASDPERFGTPERALAVSQTYDGGQGGWSGGAHCCIVEVDVETGMVSFRRYLVVEDCGLPVNPAIVEGQVRGGVVQAVGAVLLEHSAYDVDGQFQAATFMDYLLPTAGDVPAIEIHHVETVLTDPDVNFRGVGEGGMIVAPACIVNAIADALAPFGVVVQDQHLPPNRIVELVGSATA